MNPSPHVSVIILHWKHVNDTRHCLDALKQSDYQHFDVYLVLNGTTREDSITLHNVYKNWDRLTILDEPENTGFAEGNNIGIRAAIKQSDPAYILTLNNDTEITPQAISAAVAVAQRGTDMVQLLLMDFTQRNTIDSAGIRLGKSLLPFDIKNLDTNTPLFCPSAGAALYSTTLLETIAEKQTRTQGFASIIVKEYFDSQFFAYAEDLDLGFRARLHGAQTQLAPNAIVYHKGSASTKKMSDFAIYHTYRNLLWVYMKSLPNTWLLTFGIFFILGQLAILYKNLMRGQHKEVIRAWKDAYATKEKMYKKRATLAAHKTSKLSTNQISTSLF